MAKNFTSVSNTQAQKSPNKQLQAGAVPYYDNLWDLVHARASRQPAPRGSK